MDDFGVKLLRYFFGLLALTCVGMTVDSAITNYLRYKAINRVFTTMETAMKEGLLTPAEFKECVDELSNELSKKEK